jgi:signal transduction histidine kinase
MIMSRLSVSRLLVALGVLVLASSAIMGWRTQQSMTHAVADTAARHATAIVSTLAPHLDGERHELLSRSLPNPGIPNWWGKGLAVMRMHEVLVETQRANHLRHPLITLRLSEDARDQVTRQPNQRHKNALMEMFSSHDTPRWRSRHDYVPEMQRALFSGEVVHSVPADDDDATVLAWAPIKSPSGDIVGLLTAEVPLRGALATATHTAGEQTVTFLASLIVALLAIGLVLVEFNRSMRGLEAAAYRLGRGDFVTPVPSLPVQGLKAISIRLEDARQRIHAHVVRLEETEAKLVQALHGAQEATIAKSRVLAVMSEEIRAPMNTVVGTMDLLLTSDLDEQQRHYTDVIRNGASRLLGLLQHLLDYSRLDAGQMEFRKVPFALVDVVEDAFTQAMDHISDRGLIPLLYLDYDVPIQITGDPLRLRQLLQNLLDNACKFTERGEVELRARMVEDEQFVRFEVRDTGRGFLDEEQAFLFEPFTHTDSRSNAKGVGLGLAICRMLVEQQGGQIGAHAKPLRGATFWFTLPVGDNVRRAESIPQVMGMEVLVVAPHPSVSAALVSLLKGAGLHPHETDCRDDALEALEGSYDLVLLDHSMPGSNAVLDKAKNKCRVFWLTGHRLDQGRSLMRQAGVSACIQLPVRRADLITRLKAVAATRGVRA